MCILTALNIIEHTHTSSELNLIMNAALIRLDDQLRTYSVFLCDKLLSRDLLDHVWGLDICMTTLINRVAIISAGGSALVASQCEPSPC